MSLVDMMGGEGREKGREEPWESKNDGPGVAGISILTRKRRQVEQSPRTVGGVNGLSPILPTLRVGYVKGP